MISLQFYTLREPFGKDPMGTLERVAKIGYPGIEIGGYGNNNLDELVAKINELNLTVTGGHVPLEALSSDMPGVIGENRKLDNSFVIVPWVNPERRGSVENWQQIALELNEAGAQLKEAGMQLCYHHHDFEFAEKYGEQTAWDVLMEATDADLVKAEIDVYWVKKGGADPVEVIARYADRLALLHVKDMMPDGSFGEVGEGILDWPAIFEAAAKTDVAHYAVEQDQTPGDPFDSVEISLKNLKQMGIA